MFDYRDEFFNPKKGMYVLPFIEYAGGVFRGDNDFVRLEIETRHFLPVFGHVIAQRLRIGTLIPTNGCEIYEKYSLGGQYSVRGYDEKSIGPDSIAQEKYGDIVGNYNLELRLMLPWNFGLVGFFDVGYVDNEINLMRSDFFKASSGLGIRYFSPIGPVRFDMGFPLTDADFKPGFYFGIYHIF
jgi:outer membrane protein assembly factor BamA